MKAHKKNARYLYWHMFNPQNTEREIFVLDNFDF